MSDVKLIKEPMKFASGIRGLKTFLKEKGHVEGNEKITYDEFLYKDKINYVKNQILIHNYEESICMELAKVASENIIAYDIVYSTDSDRIGDMPRVRMMKNLETNELTLELKPILKPKKMIEKHHKFTYQKDGEKKFENQAAKNSYENGLRKTIELHHCFGADLKQSEKWCKEQIKALIESGELEEQRLPKAVLSYINEDKKEKKATPQS